ncbi:sensor histidine kinase [Brevibacillus sp. HB2.2]|uniref:ATP-binding protein n=1 Tax=Brevibacillus sp. HB2.2 TaxID=2738846 RepID=UPI00156B5031|nr:sensor histidine kinase [Brevibacillus sp. HB2.2]NRS46536.1 sensor histidine kinase [Brevibacillus sp. HB2.2]
MLITVPLAGELKFYPVNETFRISFGAPTFFFFLLLFQRIPSVFAGFLTGITVVCFRIVIDLIAGNHSAWEDSLQAHYSSFFFYFAYCVLFYVTGVRHIHNRTILVGLMGMVIEVLADLIEFLSQHVLLNNVLTWGAVQEMLVIALSHSFIVISFLNMMKLYEAQSREQQTRKQNEHILMLISTLYEESIHLKKTLQNAESISMKSFELYQGLQELHKEQVATNVESFAKKALVVAGEVHEIKKDNQRIFAGLHKLISDESITDYMDIHQLVDIIRRSNMKYATLLEKDIQITASITGTHPLYHVFMMLSLINNLVANAVEAIQQTGAISIEIDRIGDLVEIKINDDGPGVPPRRKGLLFKPGFTTKYDRTGNPSTGIGLSYVQQLVEQWQGEISLQDGVNGKGTTFLMRLPIDPITKKE